MPKNDNLFKELKDRFELDQNLSKNKSFEEIKKIYETNSIWLKKIIENREWLSYDIVGKQGELYAWLIVQHSPDIDFQKRVLDLLRNLPKTMERNGHIAYLTDRILIKQNKKQLYGTQFSNGQPYPIENKSNLDKRRNKMGLGSFEEYYKLMNKK